MTHNIKEKLFKHLCSSFHKLYTYIRKKPVEHILKNSQPSIISNNCIGADICHSLGLQFNSPTVNLQILPADYIKFCNNLPHYLNEDLLECLHFTSYQREQIKKHYEREVEELHFPFGVCDDILIAFQHYDSFETAKKDWYRRRTRVNLSQLGIIMVAENRYKKECELFDQITCKRKILFTINWSIQLPNTKTIPIENLPNGVHFMDPYNFFKKYYERNFNIVEWVISLIKD